MSLFNTMRTATAGLQAQSNALGTIGDNIANSGTTGYKKATAEFETALGINTTSNYESGGVQTDVRYGIQAQGTLTGTTSTTDLAIDGNGFFVVSKGSGREQFLTRAGSFVQDTSGNLVNSAGYQLMGYKTTATGTATTLSPVNISASDLNAQASTAGTLDMNLPSTAAVTSGDLPASNKADAAYSQKTSVTVYDSLGTANVLDVYLTKTGANTWDATAYKQTDASANGGFPYASAAVGRSTLAFDATTGKLTGTVDGATGAATTPARSLNVAVGGMNVPLDLGSTTQLASDFNVNKATADGFAASKLNSVKIGTDGTVTAVYASGAQVATYKIPIGTVVSPESLTSLSGNVYQINSASGGIVTSTANSAGVGVIKSSELESSTVDLATELTNMIQTQRAYEANSKVLQAGSDLLGQLNRLTVN